jgi:hypothetical protein
MDIDGIPLSGEEGEAEACSSPYDSLVTIRKSPPPTAKRTSPKSGSHSSGRRSPPPLAEVSESAAKTLENTRAHDEPLSDSSGGGSPEQLPKKNRGSFGGRASPQASAEDGSSPDRSASSPLEAEAAALEERLATLRAEVRAAEDAGRGLADAHARLAREVKLRAAMEARREGLEADVARLTLELRELEAVRLAADKMAGENADVAGQWKERSDGWEAAYEAAKKEKEEEAVKPPPPSPSPASSALQAAAIEAASAASAAAAVANLSDRHNSRVRELETQISLLKADAEAGRAGIARSEERVAVLRAALATAQAALAGYVTPLEKLCAEAEVVAGAAAFKYAREEVRAALTTPPTLSTHPVDPALAVLSWIGNHAVLARQASTGAAAVVKAAEDARRLAADSLALVESVRVDAEARVAEVRRSGDSGMDERAKLVRDWEGYAGHWEGRGREAERLAVEWEKSFDALSAQHAGLSRDRADALNEVAALKAALARSRAEGDAVKAEAHHLRDYLSALGHGAAVAGISKSIAAAVGDRMGASAVVHSTAVVDPWGPSTPGENALTSAMRDAAAARTAAMVAAPNRPAAVFSPPPPPAARPVSSPGMLPVPAAASGKGGERWDRSDVPAQIRQAVLQAALAGSAASAAQAYGRASAQGPTVAGTVAAGRLGLAGMGAGPDSRSPVGAAFRKR